MNLLTLCLLVLCLCTEEMFDMYVIFKLLVSTCASMVMLKLFIYLIIDSTLQINCYVMGLKKSI